MREDLRFVLRLWRDASDARAWRASLRALDDGRLHRFGDLADLHTFLEACGRGERPRATDPARRARRRSA